MLGIQQLRKSLGSADIGFQVSGIDERSPVKPHQTDLIDIAREDLNAQVEAYFGRHVRGIRRGGARRT